MAMFKPHRFIPRILKRASIRRKETRGYPKALNKRVARTIVPKKRINCLSEPAISAIRSFFLVWKKSLRRKKIDKIIRRIPRQKGNNPVPAIRKVSRGILRDRITVTPPKRKIAIPPNISSLFKLFPFFTEVSFHTSAQVSKPLIANFVSI